MRKLITLLTLLAVATQGWAGNSDTRNLQAVSLDGVVGVRNLVQDPGFEDVGRGWAASAGTGAASSAAKGTGSYGYSWVSTGGAGRTLDSAAVTIPAGMQGKNAVVSCAIKCVSGTCTHTLEAYDGTNPVSAQTTITSSSSTFARTSVNFVMPSSGTIAARLTTVSATEGDIYVDDCRISPADEYNISQVNQAQLIGTLRYAGNSGCDWVTTGTSWANLGTDASCNNATVTGLLKTTGGKIAGGDMTNVPPGNYLVMVNSYRSSSGGPTCFYRIHDGTTGGPGQVMGSDGPLSLSANFSYTTAQSSVTWQMQAYRTGGTNCAFGADGTDRDFEMKVYRLPSTSELALRTDQTPATARAYHDTDCAWTTTSASFTDPTDDASCTFSQTVNQNLTLSAVGNKSPAITFTPTHLGFWKVCASAAISNSTSGSYSSFRIYDGANELGTGERRAAGANDYVTVSACGYYNATTLAAATIKLQLKASANTMTMAGTGAKSIEWTVEDAGSRMAAPILVGSVTSNSAGAQAIEWVRVAGKCTSNPCTITDKSSSAMSSVTWNSTGNYTLNIASGTFSAIPVCLCIGGGAGANTICQGNTSGTATTTSFPFRTLNSSFTPTNDSFYIMCMGHK